MRDPESYHSIIERPSEYEIIELTYRRPLDGSEPYVDLELMEGDRLRRLRFFGPQDIQISQGFPNSSGLVILDVRARQMDGVGVRVANIEAHGGCPEFWARDVVEQVTHKKVSL